jgi:hypothetical protein
VDVSSNKATEEKMCTQVQETKTNATAKAKADTKAKGDQTKAIQAEAGQDHRSQIHNCCDKDTHQEAVKDKKTKGEDYNFDFDGLGFSRDQHNNPCGTC